MPIARTDAVRIGNAPTTTETIVAAKIANRCHACGGEPLGHGTEPDRRRPGPTTPIRASEGLRTPASRLAAAVDPAESASARRDSRRACTICRSSASTTYCHVNGRTPVEPGVASRAAGNRARRPGRPVPMGSASRTLKIRSPCSSVHTARPDAEVSAPSSKPMASPSRPAAESVRRRVIVSGPVTWTIEAGRSPSVCRRRRSGPTRVQVAGERPPAVGAPAAAPALALRRASDGRRHARTPRERALDAIMPAAPVPSSRPGRTPRRSAPRSGPSSRGPAPGCPGRSSSPRRRAPSSARSRSPG